LYSFPEGVGYEDRGRVEYEKGKGKGYQDKFGNWIVEPKWGDVRIERSGLIKVRVFGEDDYAMDSKFGLYNSMGEKLLDPEWCRISKQTLEHGFQNGVAVASQKVPISYKVKDGDVIKTITKEEERCFLIYNKGVKKQTKWSYIGEFVEGLALAKTGPTTSIGYMTPQMRQRIADKTKYGFINVAGEEIIKVTWRNAHDQFTQGVVGVQNNEGKWGLINTKGEPVSAFKWALIEPFSGGLAAVYDGVGAVGYINTKGELRIRIEAAKLQKFKCGLASFNQAGAWGVVNDNGEIILRPEWDEVKINDRGDGLIKIEKKDLVGYADLSGRILVDPEWDSIYPRPTLRDEVEWHYTKPREVEGFAVGRKVNPSKRWGPEKKGYLDANGNVLVEAKWDDSLRFSEGLSPAQKSEGKKRKYGYVNLKGELTIPIEWDGAWEFKEGLAPVKKGLIWGYLNQSGKLEIQPKWIQAYPFSEGLAVVKYANKMGVIDKKGELVADYHWDHIESFSNGMARVTKDKLYGYIDKTGQLVIPAEWPYAESFQEGKARVSKGGDWKYIDTRGEILSEG
jgi:hypothetical protein